MGENMEIIEIVKDAFTFPTKDVKMLAIYILLSIVSSIFATVGIGVYVLGIIIPECFMWGGIAVIISMVIGWLMSGYSISVIKSGINLDDKVPGFDWWEDFITGFYSFVVSFVYYLIPALIVLLTGLVTDIYGKIWIVFEGLLAQILSVITTGDFSVLVFGAMADAIVGLIISLTITLTVAVIVFVVFSFLEVMAQARLANTGDLFEALSIFESAKDIKRIGIAKVLIVIILVMVVIFVVNFVLSAIFNIVPILSFLSIIITPYLVLFTQRAVGLLYSDIA